MDRAVLGILGVLRRPLAKFPIFDEGDDVLDMPGLREVLVLRDGVAQVAEFGQVGVDVFDVPSCLLFYDLFAEVQVCHVILFFNIIVQVDQRVHLFGEVGVNLHKFRLHNCSANWIAYCARVACVTVVCDGCKNGFNLFLYVLCPMECTKIKTQVPERILYRNLIVWKK